MAFDIGAITARIDADITGFKKGLSEAQHQTEGLSGKLKSAGKAIGDFAEKASIISAVAIGGLTLFLKDASQEATNFERAMTTLDIIAGRFGVSGKDAQEAAKGLAKELRIGVGSAAESLQNLLKSGLNLDQAKDLLKRFTNEAITGKSPTLSLSQAVQNLSFAYATNNSALGNLSGISENFEDIVVRGKDALVAEGMAAEEVTDEMAKFRGMVDLTNLTMGSAERFTGTLIDKQAQLSQKILDLKVAIGQALNPVLSEFIGIISESGIIEGLQKFASEALPPIVEKLKEWGKWIKDNQEMVVSFLKGLALGIGAILVLAPLLVLAMHPFILIFGAIALAVAGLFMAWEKNFLGIRDITNKIVAEVIKFFNEYLKPAIQAFVAFWVERWDYVKLIVNGAWQIIKGIIEVAWNIIYGIIKVGLALISGDWKAAWEAIKQMTIGAWDGLKNIFNGAIDFIKGWGGMVVHNLVKPFEEAWNKIKEFVQKIKDNLDFTKRHSPSVVDIVNKGVSEVNKALNGLNYGINLAPEMAAAGVTNNTNGPSINNIRIDMAGAVIADEYSADRIAEIIGDNIVKKLQANIRF